MSSDGTIQICFNCCRLSTENLELCSRVDKRGEVGGVGLILSSDGTIQTCFNCCRLSTENLELCSSVDKRGEDGGVGLILSSDGIFFISNVNGLLTGTLVSSFSDYKETKTLNSFYLI